LGERHLTELFSRYPALKVCEESIRSAYHLLVACYRAGNKVLTVGNGGSAADAQHIVGELMKGFLLKRPLRGELRERLLAVWPPDQRHQLDDLQTPLPAVTLGNDFSLATAFANDVDPTLVYAQQLLGLGKSGDVLIAISTSGNSKNVVAAVHVARALGVRSIGLTGAGGGALKELCDVAICVPALETPQIQELHLPVYHALCMAVESTLFAEEEEEP